MESTAVAKVRAKVKAKVEVVVEASVEGEVKVKAKSCCDGYTIWTKFHDFSINLEFRLPELEIILGEATAVRSYAVLLSTSSQLGYWIQAASDLARSTT